MRTCKSLRHKSSVPEFWAAASRRNNVGMPDRGRRSTLCPRLTMVQTCGLTLSRRTQSILPFLHCSSPLVGEIDSPTIPGDILCPSTTANPDPSGMETRCSPILIGHHRVLIGFRSGLAVEVRQEGKSLRTEERYCCSIGCILC